jgi:hypothetical protein
MKLLVTFDRSEEEPKDISLSRDDCKELSDKQMSDVTEQSCAVGDNARGGFDKFCCIQATL